MSQLAMAILSLLGLIGYLAMGHQVMILVKYVWAGKLSWKATTGKSTLFENILGQLGWPLMLIWLLAFGPWLIHKRLGST